jgi:hypothetical protein
LASPPVTPACTWPPSTTADFGAVLAPAGELEPPPPHPLNREMATAAGASHRHKLNLVCDFIVLHKVDKQMPPFMRWLFSGRNYKLSGPNFANLLIRLGYASGIFHIAKSQSHIAENCLAAHHTEQFILRKMISYHENIKLSY